MAIHNSHWLFHLVGTYSAAAVAAAATATAAAATLAVIVLLLLLLLLLLPLLPGLQCISVSRQDNEGNQGGAIYNDGKVTMFKSAKFFDNACAVRGDGAVHVQFRKKKTCLLP